jgi:hypothetical protein
VYWETLAALNVAPRVLRVAKAVAMERLKASRSEAGRRRGIHRFLATHSPRTALPWLLNEPESLIQMLAIERLPAEVFDLPVHTDFLRRVLGRRHYEPALVALLRLTMDLRNDIVARVGEDVREPSGVIRNTLGGPRLVDSIGEILQRRYGCKFFDWQAVLGSEYEIANRLVYLAELMWHDDPGAWLNYMDSFNDILVRRWLELLRSAAPRVGWPRSTGDNGRIVDYGSILQRDNQLTRRKGAICDALREVHEARSGSLVSHPYATKTGRRTRLLTPRARSQLARRLTVAYYGLDSELSRLLVRGAQGPRAEGTAASTRRVGLAPGMNAPSFGFGD